MSSGDVDKTSGRAHNNSVEMLRIFRPLMVLGLVLAVAGAAWAQCLSTDLTPEQRACCVEMGHECGAVGMNMDCCPIEPQTQDRLQPASVKLDVVSAPVPSNSPLALLPEPHVRLHAVAAASFDREALKLPDRPAYLLLSVFLI